MAVFGWRRNRHEQPTYTESLDPPYDTDVPAYYDPTIDDDSHAAGAYAGQADELAPPKITAQPSADLRRLICERTRPEPDKRPAPPVPEQQPGLSI